MIVYHDSINIIEKPIVSAGRDNLDFGKGFYITDIWEQAETWASRLAERKDAVAIVNVYDLDLTKVQENYRYLKFPLYDENWLRFIVSCRTGGNEWIKYDIIEGGVANDRVVDTVEAYMAGFMPLEYALAELAKHQPNNQFCITNQNLIEECLTFKESIQC